MTLRSCFYGNDKTGKVLNHKVVESVINSSERMTYTDVNKILKDNDQQLIKSMDYLMENFKLMEELCKILYKKRESNRGAGVDFVI